MTCDAETNNPLPAHIDTDVKGNDAPEVPEDFCWPFRFIPDLRTHGSTTDLNLQNLHRLCEKCVEIRDWIKAHVETTDRNPITGMNFPLSNLRT